ncbi:MAG: 23S rRNA (uracil(1939)-C(5))-methyltransferase RlmD [Bacteroidia bacterium]|nr:MAG: 23S rRNA (uracil(1939)-C(5))-methyltransferase RlmD [Bacteroidia bacterium]
MGRRKVKIYRNVEITDIAAEGKAVAKLDDLVIFVTKAIPGDVVDLKITKKKKNYREAIPIHFHKYSAKRLPAFCEHFGVCGGCKWQELPYKEQLFYKQKQVVDAMERIGKVELPEILPIVPSENTLYYRNKLEYTFTNRKWLDEIDKSIPYEERISKGLGFHVSTMYDKVVDIKHCYLQVHPSNEIRLKLQQFTDTDAFDYYDLRKKKGYLRNLVVRTSSTGQIMIILVFGYDDPDRRNKIFDFLIKNYPKVDSWMYMINDKLNDSLADLELHHQKGKTYLIEKMEDLHFRIGGKSFFQTNYQQALRLYVIARAFAGLTGKEIVYDLYTGTGTIANFVAKYAKKVIGIEYVDEAIKDAAVNSEINRITNTTFYAGDIKDLLTDSFIAKNGKPDVIICDPPRAGMHERVVKTIIKTLPKKIVYISCNPATQARDVHMMTEKYKLEKIQPVDMFPHTHHVENVVLLTLKE